MHHRRTVVTYARRALRTAAAAAVIMVTATGMTPASAREAAVVPAADQPVSFVADGTTAYGTLHIPRHLAGQHLPAALLLPGSGRTNRNGDVPPTYTLHTLALIAGVLGDNGIISLRFDKYFTGQTGGAPTRRIRAGSTSRRTSGRPTRRTRCSRPGQKPISASC